MAQLERIYTIPLRKGVMQAPRTRRAKKAILVLREFISHHMKSEDIALSQALNEHIWQNGMRNPIMKVTVAAIKDDKNKVSVRLANEKVEASASTKTDKKAAKAESHKDDEKSDVKKAEAKASSEKAASTASASKAEKPVVDAKAKTASAKAAAK